VPGLYRLAVKGALWSADGERLRSATRAWSMAASGIPSVSSKGTGTLSGCCVLPWDEFPADRFVPNGYARYPILHRINGMAASNLCQQLYPKPELWRPLHLQYVHRDCTPDQSDRWHLLLRQRSIQPGRHLPTAGLPDVRLGSASQNRLYYIPVDQVVLAPNLRRCDCRTSSSKPG